MNSGIRKWGLVAVRALLTAAFLSAGFFKLAGHEMMVGTFDAIGWGQWFRYVTGAIEVGGAILLWVPGFQAFAAAGLLATMIGATVAHLTVLGPSAIPALVLGALAAIVLGAYRHQIPGGTFARAT